MTEPGRSGGDTPQGQATGDGNDRSLLSSVADVVVYAPLGLALDLGSLLPRLVERGRTQVAMARMMGEFAVRKGTEDLAANAVSTQGKIVEFVSGTGLLGARPTPPAAASPEPDPGGPSSRGVADVGRAGTTSDEPDATSPAETEDASVDAPSPDTDVQSDGGAVGVTPDADDLPIPGYDLLAASQVVPRLDSLSPDELRHVRAYEGANRGRRTILAKTLELLEQVGE